MKAINYIFLLITLLLFIPAAGAREKPDYDKSYIKRYDDKIILRTFSAHQTYEFDINSDNNENSIEYKPQVLYNLGVGIYYGPWDMGFSLSKSISGDKEDEEKYGKSQYNELQFNYYGKLVGIDLNLHQYKGFYLANPEIFYPSWQEGDPYPQFPELSVLGADFNIFFNFNSQEHSLSAAFDQSKKQLKSAGSFLLMASFSQLFIFSDQKLIPPDEQPAYGEAANFEGGNFSTIAILPGYAYTFLFYDFYFTPVLFFGPGYQAKTFFIDGSEVKSRGFTYKLHFRTSLGYNSDTFFINFSFLLDNTQIYHDGGLLQISPRSMSTSFNAGYKF